MAGLCRKICGLIFLKLIFLIQEKVNTRYIVVKGFRKKVFQLQSPKMGIYHSRRSTLYCAFCYYACKLKPCKICCSVMRRHRYRKSNGYFFEFPNEFVYSFVVGKAKKHYVNENKTFNYFADSNCSYFL